MGGGGRIFFSSKVSILIFCFLLIAASYGCPLPRLSALYWLSFSRGDFFLYLITIRILTPFFLLLTGLSSLHQILSTAWTLKLDLVYLSFTTYKKFEVTW